MKKITNLTTPSRFASHPFNALKGNLFPNLTVLRSYALTVFMFLCITQVHAQTTLTPHFTAESKKIIIPKDASVLPEIHEGLIGIYHSGNNYYVKLNGEYLFGSNFPLSKGNAFYRSAYFSGGAMMAWRKDAKGYGQIPFIIYPDGKYRDFPTGLRTSTGASLDVIDAFSFCEGYALVKRGNLASYSVAYIDKNGKEVFPLLGGSNCCMNNENQIYPVRENRRLYFDFKVGKYGYADEKGNIVIKPQFDKGENFNDGMALVMLKEGFSERWGYIDLSGKIVIPITYKIRPGRFSEGWAPVKIGEYDSDYEMTYIDKTGKRVMDRQPWNLNEFHDGYAWVGTGCDKLFVMNRNFEEVRNVTDDFYHSGNGFGVCMFKMYQEGVGDKKWGIDFPNGMQALHQGGMEDGDIFAPDGTLLFKAVDAKGKRVNLHNITEGDLFYCQVRFENEPRLKEKDILLPCFINKKGEVVYYFIEDYEGYEGITPIQIK